MKIDNIILNVSCEEVLDELQTQLQNNGIQLLQRRIDSGKNIQVQCPYHGNGQERRPSAGIRKEDGLFHCFACGQAHTLPEVISYCFGRKDFGSFGLQWLVRNFSAISVEERNHVKIDIRRTATSNEDGVDNNQPNYVTEEELDTYRYYHNYWTKRGITDDNIIDLFDLGYDVNTDCITFPNRDVNGNCLFVARRSVRTKYFNYPKDVDKPLYGWYELNRVLDKDRNTATWVFENNKLYITESMIDCLLLWQAGKYALALNGVGSERQIVTINKIPCRHIVLATDNDKAGIRARNTLRKSIKNKLITEVNFPDDIKDIGDLGMSGRFDDIRNIERWEVF